MARPTAQRPPIGTRAACPARRHVAGLPGLLRPARHPEPPARRRHQRRARFHLDGGQPDPGPPPGGPGGGLRPPGRDVPRRDAWRTTRRGRAETPADLPPQFDMIREVIAVARHPRDRGAGVRGGRRPGHAGHRGPRPRREVIIVTGDRDSFQLVEDPYIRVLYNRRGVSDYALYDEAGIVERSGVPPSKYAAAGRPARRPVGQPARRPGRGGEDGGQAPQRVRRPRRDLRPPRRPDARSSARTWPTNEERVRLNAEVIPLVRDVPLDVHVDELAARRVGPRGRPRRRSPSSR